MIGIVAAVLIVSLFFGPLAASASQSDSHRRFGSRTALRRLGALSRHSLNRRTRRVGLSSISAQGGDSLLAAILGARGTAITLGGFRFGVKIRSDSASSPSAERGVLVAAFDLVMTWIHKLREGGYGI